MNQVVEIESGFQRGDFSGRERLGELLGTNSRGGNAELAPLFAAVAAHGDVAVLAEALSATTDPACARQLVVALGLTLSSEAVPLVLEAAYSWEDAEVDAYAALALDTLWPVPGLHEDSVRSREVKDAYLAAGASAGWASQPAYIYRGRPLFVGDLCKELVTAAVTSLETSSPLVLIHQAEILSCQSGSRCPVEYGLNINEVSLQVVYDYVKTLSGLGWQRGEKYYFQCPAR
jgi:hypothetical protein